MRLLIASCAVALAWMPGTVLLAGHGDGVCCPACNYYCEFAVEQTTVKKTEFDFECKPICIPPITFPWEKCGGKGKNGDCAEPPRCGKVKVVKVLTKHSYECPACKCTWSAVSYDGDGKKQMQSAPVPGGTDVPPPPAVQPVGVEPPVVDPQSASKETGRSWKGLLKLSTYGAEISRRFVSAVSSR